MPNIKSAKKSIITSEITKDANKVYTSRVRNSLKKVEAAVKNKDKEVANAELKVAVKNIDKATSKGLMKKNTANRQKSRLNKKVKEID